LEKWRKANPGLSKKFDSFMSGQSPEIDYSSIVQGENIASRSASSTVLSHFAAKIENMLVSSADLANSDKCHT